QRSMRCVDDQRGAYLLIWKNTVALVFVSRCLCYIDADRPTHELPPVVPFAIRGHDSVWSVRTCEVGVNVLAISARNHFVGGGSVGLKESKDAGRSVAGFHIKDIAWTCLRVGSQGFAATIERHLCPRGDHASKRAVQGTRASVPAGH